MDVRPELTGAVLDIAQATVNFPQYDGLDSLKDYTKLYPNNWENILPDGPDAGAETNFTQDLFFSMERLSSSPYQVRRLNPSSDSVAFQVDDATAKTITGSTLQSLFSSGRLFYADYRDQKGFSPTNHYGAACDAYFYIDSSSGDFLPLAIRTNVGANLVYTRQDTANNWLLAKIMLNVNDFWFAQWNHLAQTHEVVQIAYMAAIALFALGTVVDQIFPFTGSSAQDYTTDYYKNKGSGRFQPNYFETELEARGLINSNVGPALKNFPFYEDASTIHDAIEGFMTTFVKSYYPTNRAISSDEELQAWVTEAQGPAEAIDFPSTTSTTDLIDVLTHFAHLASTSHHTVNTNELLDISSTLPFHPPALYKPVPTRKGVKNVASFLPPFVSVLDQFVVGALFARPKFAGSQRALLHMFDDPTMLDRMNPKTKAAAAKFQQQMQAFSSQVSAKTFDADGLSQGMPFVWRALDPNVAPYSITT